MDRTTKEKIMIETLLKLAGLVLQIIGLMACVGGAIMFILIIAAGVGDDQGEDEK